MGKVALSSSQADSASGMPGITVDKSVEFSYEELFNATEGFSMSHKIGQGGFGVVYYAELRGKVSLNFHGCIDTKHIKVHFTNSQTSPSYGGLHMQILHSVHHL